jgi:Ser/Thr protein kinase RdoA (MazF antagonist)
MLRLIYPDRKLISLELITGGCANFNFKIQLEDEEHSLILRVYLRDKDAAYREQKLAALLKPSIPVPLSYSISEVDGYHFAITEFMPGLLLRDLLLGDVPQDISAIMHDVGTILSKIAIHELPHAGFFNKDLNVIPHAASDDCLIYDKNCLKDRTVLAVLPPEMIININTVLDKYGHLFPGDSVKHLVHGDFDPANILVNNIDGTWKVSGVLDWEFAFSGSVLWDVANMLRYAHKMPTDYQEAFLNGLTSGGISLDKNWRVIIKLLNLSALLDCLKRSDPKNKPNQCANIRELIHFILTELNTML